MIDIEVEKLETKTKEELIEIITNLKKECDTQNRSVHVFSNLDKLKDSPILQSKIEKIYKYSNRVSVMMFNIYNLKNSDEIYDTQISNQIFKEVTQMLKYLIRSTDILIKYGEENFIIIAPNTDIKGIEKYAQKVKKVLYNNEFDTISHLKSNFSITQFKDDDTITDVINRLLKSLLEVEKSSVKDIAVV